MSGNQKYKSGYTVGNGAAINIELGWIPNRVELANLTDGDIVTTGYLGRIIPFSSGGTTEVVAGMTIKGATSLATAVISEVLLYSGSWAGGDAAGFFVTDVEDIVGTFGSEAAYISSDTVTGADDCTVTAAVEHTVAFAAAAATATGNSAITSYVGAAGTNAKGFTIGSTIAEEAKLLRWSAWRN